ncbi:MAG TPA: DUF4350 domain-containing protein [Pedobacter sp.]|jgi:hypothetical protein
MKDLKIYSLIAFVILCFYLVAQYNKPKPVSWKPTFSKKDKIPYGTFILFNRLNDLFPNSVVRADRESPYLTLTEGNHAPGNYLLISQKIKLDQYDFRELEKYMRKGNNVLIAGFDLSSYLTDSLHLTINSELKTKENFKTPIQFVNSSLKSTRPYLFEKGIGDQYFSSFDSAKAVILGTNNLNHANFIKYQYGKGSLYLVASPMFFTNYGILQKDGAEYVSKVLSHLPVKEEIIWDEFLTLGPIDTEKSPLRVILSISSLKWAYMISICTLILFVLYEMKRRQRIIPIIEPLKNTSAEFIKVVGQLYYQKRNNLNIAQKKVSYLLEDIRSRYAIKTSALDEEFEKLLTTKSAVKNELVRNLVSQILQISNSKSISDHELIALNKNIEQFHQQSRA